MPDPTVPNLYPTEREALDILAEIIRRARRLPCYEPLSATDMEVQRMQEGEHIDLTADEPEP